LFLTEDFLAISFVAACKKKEELAADRTIDCLPVLLIGHEHKAFLQLSVLSVIFLQIAVSAPQLSERGGVFVKDRCDAVSFKDAPTAGCNHLLTPTYWGCGTLTRKSSRIVLVLSCVLAVTFANFGTPWCTPNRFDTPTYP